MQIDFSKLGMPVFTGRERGEELRRKLGLDALPESESVEVLIPSDVYTMTSSYFLGLFGSSVRSAGSREKFMERFVFYAPEHVSVMLDDWITRALREQKDLFKAR